MLDTVCTEMHVGGHFTSCRNVEVESTVVAAVRSRLTGLTASHERKHNACRAQSEAVLKVIPISEEDSPSYCLLTPLMIVC